MIIIIWCSDMILDNSSRHLIWRASKRTILEHKSKVMCANFGGWRIYSLGVKSYFDLLVSIFEEVHFDVSKVCQDQSSDSSKTFQRILWVLCQRSKCHGEKFLIDLIKALITIYIFLPGYGVYRRPRDHHSKAQS